MARTPRRVRPRSRMERADDRSAYARTTITVPRDLKALMETAGYRVNWSAVACDAFEKWLSETETKERTMPELPDKDDAIERLRRLKHESESGRRGQIGRAFTLGQHWAMADAHPLELQRLEEFCRCHAMVGTTSELHARYPDRRTIKELFRDFTLWVLGHRDRLRSEEDARLYPANIEQVRPQMKPFWEERVGVSMMPGTKDYGPEFLSDFSAGALAFWDEAKSQL